MESSTLFEKAILGDADRFPPQVKKLAWRERQIASIIYARGPSTAKDVEAALAYNLKNASVRTMLRRLVRKQIIRQRLSREGHAFVYVPAITTDTVVRKAFVQIAKDHFDGSLLQAAIAITLLVKDKNDAAHLLQAALVGESKP